MTGFLKKVCSVLASLSLCVLSPLVCASSHDDGAFPPQFVFIGDSLTDQGNNPYTGSFSPHADMWSRWLADYFNGHEHDADPSSQGGLNFAYEGVTIRQAEAYFAREFPRRHLDRDAIIFLWLGANDMLDVLKRIELNPLAALNLLESGSTAAVGDYEHLLDYLMGQGFHVFLVANLPSLGDTPAAKAAGALGVQIADMASEEFNGKLDVLLNTKYKDANIATLDVNGMFKEILEDLGAFGFKYADGFACLPQTEADHCVERYPGALNDYLFADLIHPTGKVQKIMGDYAFSVISAPLEVGTLPLLELSSERMLSLTVDHSLLGLGDSQPGDVHYMFSSGYYSYDAPSPSDLKVSKDAQYRAHIAVIVDKSLSQDQHFGLFSQLAFGHGDVFEHFSYRMSDYMVGMYYRWMMRRVMMTWFAGLGVTNFPYLGRHFSLGQVQRIEEGSSFGYHGYSELAARLPLIHRSRFDVDAFSSLEGHIEYVRPYTEQGARATTMTFALQEQQYFLGTLGLSWHTHTQWHHYDITPRFDVSWTHNFRHTPPVTKASLLTFPHWFWLPAFGYQKDQFLVSAGLSGAWSKSLSFRVDFNQYLKSSIVDPSGLDVSVVYKF